MEYLLRTADGRLDFPVYPGHAITIAVQIAKAFPNYEAAAQRGHEYAAALESSDVSGAGGNVYAALFALKRLRGGESLESVLALADASVEHAYRDKWPAACEQARRYLATVDLIAWVRA